jgi:hypothetical protein
MKTRLTSLLLFLFISPCFAGTWVPLQVDMKGSHEAHSGTSAEEKHHRWLEIKVSGTGLKDSAQLRLEWTFFADDLSADKIVKQADGTETIELLAGKSGAVKTKEVIFDYTRQHSERIRGGRRPVFKKIDATGHRYHGWVVRAFIGNEKVGEASSSRDVAQLVAQSAR